MRVAIDARAYGWAGIGRYIRSLLHAYTESGHVGSLVVFAGEDQVPRIKKDMGGLVEVVEVSGSYYSWQEQTILIQQLSSLQADLFHFTHFNVPLFFNRPYVVTIHDITRFMFPGQVRQSLLVQLAYEMVFRNAVTRSKGVISVSKTTEQELRRMRLSLPDHLEVIYEGVDESFFAPARTIDQQKVRALLDVSGDYLLYTGVWMSHKNLRRLLEAFAIVLQDRPNLKLVMTGKPKPGYRNMIVEARAMGLEENVVFPGFVDDRLMPALYQGALLLVFPSLYEGFGLPALEAAAGGTPVVCSNVSSLPEVMGEAGIYVNPESVDSIVSGMIDGLQEGFNRVDIGRKQARRFSWNACAQETWNMYERIAK